MRLAIEERVVDIDPDGEPVTSPALDHSIFPADQDDKEPAPEVSAPPPDGADSPEVALIMFSLENGRVFRSMGASPG